MSVPIKTANPAGSFPEWWDRREFFTRYGDRQIDTGHPVCVNYGLLLTSWEAAAWDEKCRAAFTQDPRSREASVIEAMRQWAALLKTARWIIIESYEWESGLD